MKQIIKKNSDGTLEYDFNKYFNLHEALLAEWKENSPEMDRDILSKLMDVSKTLDIN